ncbi:MAG: 2-oxo acid dehydrogenase subunit E2 [Bacteroidetes bacterium]|jgi:2-oxoglutarate dehydrogenase E2 component (dihydrolipoamide succinyltransferase)|nr:2-oxo acid dehydrogenase subunit E2 [Bacteroidota bacterium]
MAQFELVMPKMGESINEATVIRWLKSEGDTVEVDEAILEVATDKVDSEVPAPEAGTITKFLCGEGDVIPVGQAVAIIETEGASASAPASAPVSAPVEQAKPVEVIQEKIQEAQVQTVTPSNTGDRFYSPLVLNIARKEGISMSQLETLPGSGKNGRVTKKDILAYVKNGAPATTTAPAATPATAPVAASKPVETVKPTVSLNAGDEIIEMDRMRKLIADHMVMSKQVSPHVSSFVEADVTNLVNWRNKNKAGFQQREGERLTFTPLFIEAVVKAIKDFPMINIEVNGDNIIKRKAINVGMAAALPSGNLIVPVIKNADTKNLVGLAREVNDLANRARNNALKPDEISGGTYTITNVGTFGNLMGTPIINQPQVAILATGAIVKKPAVIETQYGDVIGIRHFMYLSHSYDHRVVDGALGGMFVKRVAEYLENWDMDREA